MQSLNKTRKREYNIKNHFKTESYKEKKLNLLPHNFKLGKLHSACMRILSHGLEAAKSSNKTHNNSETLLTIPMKTNILPPNHNLNRFQKTIFHCST
jgi:hypothetical protein